MNWTISKYVFLAALVVTMALPTAQTASAAPIIVGTYYEENGSVGCGASSFGCGLFFTAVPAGKLLLITRLSCLITEDENRIAFVALGQRNNQNGVFRRQYFDVSLVSSSAGFRRFAVNGEADLLIG